MTTAGGSVSSDRDEIRVRGTMPGSDQLDAEADAESEMESTGQFTIDYTPPAWYTQNAAGRLEQQEERPRATTRSSTRPRRRARHRPRRVPAKVTGGRIRGRRLLRRRLRPHPLFLRCRTTVLTFPTVPRSLRGPPR
ncbi:SCO5717 family growth-regulating ATPase [Streptomyces albus]